MTSRIARVSAALFAVALVAAACGDDDDSDDLSSDATEEVTTTEAEDTSADEEGDIVDTADAAGDFTTLVAAVQAAGLEETLRGDGPCTVFAPTDAAFEALPEGTVDALLEDPEGDLTSILTYHVVEGEYLSSDLSDGQTLTTLSGDDLTVSIDGGDVTVDGAQIVRPDIDAGNGVIHIINGVIRPPSS